MKTSNKKAYIFKMNITTASVFSIVVFFLMVFLTLLLDGLKIFSAYQTPFILCILVGYFFLHELIHGIGFILGGSKLKNIKLGAALEKGIFYCMSYQELTKKNILISLQMPFMVIGVITYIIGIVFNIPILTWLSILNIMGASMDLVMFFYILRIKNVTYSESGEPDEFVLISNEDLSKRKSIFLKLKDVKDYKKEDYIFTDFKRIEVSKASWIVILILIGLDLITLLLG